MSNFVSYDNAEDLMTGIGNKIKVAEIEYSVWNAMTDAEKEAYCAEHPKIDILNSPESGGGGGHVIQDASGTDLVQEDTLQFGGYLQASDDSQNGKTVVKDVDTVTWATWQTMTDQQKAGKHWVITGAPGEISTDQAIIGLYNQTLTFTNLVATISDNRIEANDAVFVFFSDDSVAETAGIEITWSAGTITFTATTTPSSTLSVNAYIIKPALASPSENVTADHVSYGNTNVASALDGLSSSISGLGTAAGKDFTTSVTSGSNDLVTSGAVYSYIDTAITQVLNTGF